MSDRLDVGAVIRRVFEIYVDQAPVLLPASAVVFVISGIVASVLVSAGPGAALIAFLISFVAGALFTGMIVELVADVQDGRRDHSASQLLKAIGPVLGQLLSVAVLAAIGIGVGFTLIVVPGLILLTIWAVVAPVVVLERPGVLASFGRSRQLVRGNGWQTFGVVLVLAVLVEVVAAIVDVAAESASTGVGIVVRVVLGVLIGPLSALAAAVLYFELRRLHGGAAIDTGMARAGAVESDFGSPDPPTSA
ncbi:MAG TPA: YciC family protein [Solirubrobacteraceae bacterium]|jgi:hypothetical protein|nr:YciC family protein [Solirubrobacteraceae bacterium]